jgi:3-methylfumaryl-CoA hydratase
MPLAHCQVGDPLPERTLRPDEVQLFLYNAALFNAHRIHFDRPYATGVEGYPGLVVPGPLLGDLIGQCVLEWLGEAGVLTRLQYSNRRACYCGESVHVGGRVTAVDTEAGTAQLELWVRNAAAEVLTPGTAVVRFAGERA